MSPTSKSRKRKRRSQLVAVRAVPDGYQPQRPRIDGRTMAQQFDDWMLSLLSARVAALLFVLACGIASVLAIVAGYTIDDLHAYENAPYCEGFTTTACRQEDSVFIGDVGKTSGKNADYYIDVSGIYIDVSGEPQTTTIYVRDGSGAWAVAHAGDYGNVELWNGVPVSITADGATSETTVTPHKTMVDVASFALAALAGAAMFAVFWIRRLHYRYSGGRRWPEWLTLLEPAMTFATIGLIIGAVVATIAESLVVTVAMGSGITLFAVAIFSVSSWRSMTGRT